MSTDAIDVATITVNAAIDRMTTIDNFRAGTVNRVSESRDTPGGKGVNVASALADYGLRVAVTGLLGRENDAAFGELFASKGIADRFVRINGETRVGIKIVDPASSETTDINFPGAAAARADLPALLSATASIRARWWLVAGSLPPGVEPTFYRELIRGLKERGASVALDTSGAALRAGIEAGPDIIKPNVHELEALLGRKLGSIDGIVEAARELLKKGVAMVVVSMGAEGACFVTPEATVITRSSDIKVLSTVGAGDAMVAGILAAQVLDLPLVETARLASAFALVKLKGCSCSWTQVNEGLREVACRSISAG